MSAAVSDVAVVGCFPDGAGWVEVGVRWKPSKGSAARSVPRLAASSTFAVLVEVDAVTGAEDAVDRVFTSVQVDFPVAAPTSESFGARSASKRW